MISFLFAALLAAHPAPPRAADPVIGTWMNRKGTVAVRTAHCGGGICGRVVWAAAAAQEAARAGGTDRLVGTEVFHEMRPTGPGAWEGEVFVPDLGQTADATMALIGPSNMEINGCSFGGFLCKKQEWHKVAEPPRGR